MYRNFLISRENKSIYNKSYYIKDNKKIFLNTKDLIKNNTKTYEEVELATLLNRKNKFSISNSIIKTDTISCIIKTRHLGVTGNITALNFANALVPGGGYSIGGNAQEESLCRASLLFYSIRTQKKMYSLNLNKITSLYSNAMIYSKDIPIFRDNEGNLLGEPIKCSFITSSAVNKNIAKFFYSQNKINDIMQQRINKIVSLAVLQNSEVIILGAYGCGAFGNKTTDVFLNFENAINEFVHENIRVIFACI